MAELPVNYEPVAVSNTAGTAQVEQSNQANVQPDVNASVKSASLQTKLKQIIADNEAKGITTSVSLYAMQDKNKQRNQSLLQHNNSTAQFAASINKLPVALLLLQDLRSGKTTLDQQVTWQAEDVRGGFGVYDQPGAPRQASVRQLLFDMLNYSGNTAVRSLVNYKLQGPQAVNDRLNAIPQIPTTRLQVLTPTSFFLGNSTSAESAWIIQALLGDPRDQYHDFVKDALQTNIFSYYGVRSQLEGNDYVTLANKVGILDDVDGNNRHDVGVIYNTKTKQSFGYSFMTTTANGNIAGTARAESSLDLLGRETLRYAGDKAPKNKPKALNNGRIVTPEKRVQY